MFLKLVKILLPSILVQFVLCNFAWAEDLLIKMKPADELKKSTEIEIELEFEPENAFQIEPEIKLNLEPLLFKLVDAEKNKIRLFFDPTKLQYFDELILEAKLKRKNYNGEADVKIKNIDFIADFSKSIDKGDIESSIEIVKNISDEPIPYIGISSANLLGPTTRIFSPEIFIAIGDLETYGFSLENCKEQIKINEASAELIKNNMLTASLNLEKMPENNQLDLEISVLVNNELVKKSVGSITLKDPVQ